MGKLIKIIDFLAWSMMLVTLVVAIATMLVGFGISWRSGAVYFINLKMLEICLAITLGLWGTTAVILKDKKSKVHGVIAYFLTIMLIIFLTLRIY
ncbi:MAG: hypothetical protein RR840_04015 [Clostridium sp.]